MIIDIPFDRPCRKDVLKADFKESFDTSSSLELKILMKAKSLPNDFTVLALQTVSLIKAPADFSNFSDFSCIALTTFMWIDPQRAIIGEIPKTTRVNCQE